VTLNLCSAHGAINFCHWLLDSLSRLELVERAGISFADIDHILLPRFPGKTAEWVLSTLKLPSEKLIHPDQRDQFQCETLLQPSFPGYVASYPPWVVEFYRRHFPAPTVPRRRRLYIPRRGMRGLTNADAVEGELRQFGFEPFEPAHQTDLHLKFADVSHVVGVHGAGLANLVFCPPGTRVLELLPSDLRNPYYYSLCNSAGMPYGVVVGKSTKERRRPVDVPTQSPFTVNIDELSAATAVLVGGGVTPAVELAVTR
jgi:capsular polysaccharide biosynthesis protein